LLSEALALADFTPSTKTSFRLQILNVFMPTIVSQFSRRGSFIVVHQVNEIRHFIVPETVANCKLQPEVALANAVGFLQTAMTVPGTTQTCVRQHGVSASPPKADLTERTDCSANL
jgi:hypothetical protein